MEDSPWLLDMADHVERAGTYALVSQGEGGDAQAHEPPLQEEVGAGGGGGGQTGDAQGADPSEEEVGEGGEAAGGDAGPEQAMLAEMQWEHGCEFEELPGPETPRKSSSSSSSSSSSPPPEAPDLPAPSAKSAPKAQAPPAPSPRRRRLSKGGSKGPE